MNKQAGAIQPICKLQKKKNTISVHVKYNYKYEHPYSEGMIGTMIRAKGGDWRMKPYPLQP